MSSDPIHAARAKAEDRNASIEVEDRNPYPDKRTGGIVAPRPIRLVPGEPPFEPKPEDVQVRFPLVTAQELATNKYNTVYLIESILVANELCFLVAPLKTLKTSIAILLAITLCAGIKLFGMFVVPNRKRVGYFSGESGESTIQSIFLRICRANEIDPKNIDKLFFTFSVPRIDDVSDMQAMEEFIVVNRIEVAFFDCFYFMLGEWSDKAGNLFSMGNILRKLMDIQKRTGCTMIVVHHTPKHTQCGEPRLDQAAFAGVAEAARQWILLNRIVEFDTAEKRMKHELWFVAGGSAGHNSAVALEVDEGSQSDPGSRSWALTATPAGEARQEMAEERRDEKEERRIIQSKIELKNDRATLLNLLENLTEPETKTQIRDMLGLSGPRFTRAFTSLVKDKSLSTFQIRKANNHPYDAFLLAKHADEYRSRQQPSATGSPLPPGPVASEQATPLIGGCPDATPSETVSIQDEKHPPFGRDSMSCSTSSHKGTRLSFRTNEPRLLNLRSRHVIIITCRPTNSRLPQRSAVRSTRAGSRTRHWRGKLE